MQTILFIVSILLFLVLMMLIMATIHKPDSVSKKDVKRLRVENEDLRKELRKHGIIEYV